VFASVGGGGEAWVVVLFGGVEGDGRHSGIQSPTDRPFTQSHDLICIVC